MSLLVSIIVPCYNYGNFLSETLDSVLCQTYNNWECLVIDDGSTDNTKEVADFYRNKDSRIKYFYQENRGLPAARNHGLAVSSGDFIQFLDADDLLEESKIEVQMDFILKNDHVGIVYGSMLRFDSETKEETGNDSWMPKISGQGHNILSCLIKGNIMVVSAPIIRKSIFKNTGIFNTEYRSMEDWELWLRCALYGVRFEYIEGNNTGTRIRSHKNNMMLDNEIMEISSFKLRYELQNKITDRDLKLLNRDLLNHNYGKYGLTLIHQGKTKKGIRYLLKIKQFCFFYYIFNAFKLIIKKFLR